MVSGLFFWLYFTASVQRMGAPNPISGCKFVSGQYQSSYLELEWLKNIHIWQYEYCKHMNASSQEIITLQRYVEHHTGRFRNNSLSHLRARNRHQFMSSFYSVRDCGTVIKRQRSFIEPLFASLRHPRAIVCSEQASKPDPIFIMNAAYIVLESGSSLQSRSTPRRLYFDVGASSFSGLSQQWMLSAYRDRGIVFDRILLWEAKQAYGADIFGDIPPDLYSAYQHFNIAVNANMTDPRNPLNILRTIATPADFVSFKLDIDSNHIEMAFVTQILNDPIYKTLIDEFFFEHHFNFPPLVNCCWRKTADRKLRLNDSYYMFLQLRNLGIRAHYWP